MPIFHIYPSLLLDSSSLLQGLVWSNRIERMVAMIVRIEGQLTEIEPFSVTTTLFNNPMILLVFIER